MTLLFWFDLPADGSEFIFEFNFDLMDVFSHAPRVETEEEQL